LNSFVVDNSVVLSWIFKDENSRKSEDILKKLMDQKALVPSLWPYELANALFVAEKSRRIKEADSVAFINNLKNLPICIEENDYDNITKDVLSISREHKITVYDASYAELAIRKSLAVASFDKKLVNICSKIGVVVI